MERRESGAHNEPHGGMAEYMTEVIARIDGSEGV